MFKKSSRKGIFLAEKAEQKMFAADIVAFHATRFFFCVRKNALRRIV
ncbi:MAG TPA: hypothetical protein VIH89_16450 [Candidatus Sulfotelmatobacter sp.]